MYDREDLDLDLDWPPLIKCPRPREYERDRLEVKYIGEREIDFFRRPRETERLPRVREIERRPREMDRRRRTLLRREGERLRLDNERRRAEIPVKQFIYSYIDCIQLISSDGKSKLPGETDLEYDLDFDFTTLRGDKLRCRELSRPYLSL